ARPAEPAPPGGQGAPAPRSARAARAASPITLDGLLDEPAWAGAAPLEGFVQRLPAEGAPATQATLVRILYDDTRLIIGADLLDAEPGRIIAREMKEDGDLSNDDLFGVLLDTFHDRRNAYYFATNPNGARSDALIYDEGRTQSFDWDGVWDVAARVTERGWSVEMEIPFKTLHFHASGDRTWGLQLWRLIRREAEDVFWSPIPRAEDLYRVSRAGTLEGLEGIGHGTSLTVKPYVLGSASRIPSLGEDAVDGRGDIGLDARYDVTPSLSAIVTVNTDFAETEVDDQQVNTTRFSLFFPEKREFFLESTGYFDFGFNRRGPGAPPGIIPFFSRRIGLSRDTGRPIPILGGVKVAGRAGRYNLGFLSVTSAEDEGEPQTNVSVLRVSRDILSRSNWGIVGVSSEPAGPDRAGDPNDPSDDRRSNRTWGADLNFSALENFKFGGAWLATDTPGESRGQGQGHAYAYWSDDRWNLELSYRDIAEGFNPEAGFVRRTGIEEGEAAFGWSWRSDAGPVRQVHPHTRLVYTMDQEHELATRYQHWGNIVLFRDNSEIELAWNPTFDELTETFVLSSSRRDPLRRVEVRPGAYRMDQFLVLWDGDPSKVVSGSAFIEFGDFFDGDFMSADVGVAARFSRHLSARLSVQRTDIDLPPREAALSDPEDPNSALLPELPASEFAFTLAQARIGVTFTTRLFFDALIQYNTQEDDLSSNLRFNWKYRPGSDLYLVYNERRDVEGLPTDLVDRSVTMKWTYQTAF
ncbi:MAG TPA: DUF5916 domain-containing protein, partial [Candidatus Polarisedimenticolia bacterium]|nr:DUF5916 domain-containing protein [Candidatus Polarisedimenticolia bacterium]